MPRSADQSRVVITGAGCITNVGHDAPSTWDSLVRGRSGISRIIDDPPFNNWDESHWSTHIAGAIRGWDETTHLNKREVKRLDRFAVLGISAGCQAVEASGIDPPDQ